MITSKRLTLILVALLGFFSGCQTTQTQKIHADYLSAWDKRLERHRQEFVARESVIRKKDADGWAEVSTSSDVWDALVTYVFKLTVDIKDAYEVAGRGDTVIAFVGHMRTKPTPGLTDIWFSERADDLKRESEAAREKSEKFFAQFDKKLQKNMDWMLELEQIAREQGLLSGKLAELELLNQQAIGYFIDESRAQNVDRQEALNRSQAGLRLLAAGAMMSQMSYQQQATNALRKPRICSFSSNTMVCY